MATSHSILSFGGVLAEGCAKHPLIRIVVGAGEAEPGRSWYLEPRHWSVPSKYRLRSCSHIDTESNKVQ